MTLRKTEHSSDLLDSDSGFGVGRYFSSCAWSRWGRLFLLLSFVSGYQSASAQSVVETFGAGSNQFTMEFVTIGNPNNPADTTGSPNPAGSVVYSYNLGKQEVSRDMINKANTAGGLGITMADMSRWGGNGVNRPATGITWNEAATYVNWLNTSTGGTPAYKFAGGTFTLWSPEDAGYNPNNQFRNSLAKYVIASNNEWYKGAYGNRDGTWNNYATGSDSAPTAVASGTTANTAVYSVQGPADITSAGGLSPYETMGQSGNVWEWNETGFDGINNTADENREVRGGTWGSVSDSLGASVRFSYSPTFEYDDIGFRVAVVSSTTAPSDFTFTDNNGEVTITGYTGTGGNVVIPGTIGGLPVTSIGNYAFQSKSNLTAVTIPDGVTTIGSNAFADCANLASVILPSSVTLIMSGAFFLCPELTTISIPSSVDEIQYNTFFNCSKLASVYFLRNTPPTIGSDAFKNIASGAVGYYPAIASAAWGSVTVAGLTFPPPPDTQSPVITLIGANPLEVFKGTTFSDPGAMVMDDKDATKSITGVGTVNTATVGIYTLNYTTTDAAGNLALPVTRTVNVVLDPAGDEDGDGISNGGEISGGTNPYQKDSDNDGVNDSVEITDGTNPSDASSYNNLNKGLVAYYRFSGNANDSSGNGNSGIPVSPILAVDRLGAANAAYTFNGTTDRINLSNSAALNMNDGVTFSMSAWIKTDFGDGQRVILAKAVGALVTSPALFVDSDGKLRFDNYGISEVHSSTTVRTGTWMHVAVTYDGSTYRLYVNGVADGEKAFTGSSESGNSWTFSIGGSLNTSFPSGMFKGSIDEVQFWSRTLSPTEVAGVVQASSAPENRAPVIAGQSTTYDALAEFIAGPTLQSANSRWQYLGGNAFALALLGNWKTAGNEVIQNQPQWDGNSGSLSNYPFVQRINSTTGPVSANTLVIHPSNMEEANRAVAIGWKNTSSQTVAANFNVSFRLPYGSANGIDYKLQRGLAGSSRYLSIRSGSLQAGGSVALTSDALLEMQAGEMLYLIVDSKNNFDYDHTEVSAFTVTVAGEANLDSISQGVASASNSGTAVTVLTEGSSDDDSGALKGIAVTGVDATHGSWEYTLNGGNVWNSLSGVSPSSARLLKSDGEHRVRFVPNESFNGNAEIRYRAWDQTSGEDGALADLTGAGGGAWVLVAYGAQASLGGSLTAASGSFSSSARTGSAVMPGALDILKNSSELAMTWTASGGSSPSGGTGSYTHGIAFALPNAAGMSFDGSASSPLIYNNGGNPIDSSFAVGSSSPDQSLVNVRTLVGSPGMPSQMYLRNKTFGAGYGSVYGLVMNDGSNAQLDYGQVPDSQAFKAVYLDHATGDAQLKGLVMGGSGGAQNSYVPSTMAMWARLDSLQLLALSGNSSVTGSGNYLLGAIGTTYVDVIDFDASGSFSAETAKGTIVVSPAIVASSVPFTYTIDNEKVTITGYTGTSTVVVIPNTINGVPVTAIGPGAFYDRVDLTSLTIPESVTSIGGGAFSSCYGLTNITIPKNVTTIEGGAFGFCTSLSVVNFETITPPTLGEGAFSGVQAGAVGYYPSTASVAWEGQIISGLTLTPYPFTYTVGEGVVTITGYTGTGGNVVIPATIGGFPVTKIGDNAFYFRTTLTSITIPDSVIQIGQSAFHGCSGLLSASIGSGVTNLPRNAFTECVGLTSVSLGANVKTLGDYAFNNCIKLSSITFPAGFESMGTRAFALCAELTSITFPQSVTAIGSEAFYGCTKLATVYFQGNTPPTIEWGVFSGTANGAKGYYRAGATGYASLSISGLTFEVTASPASDFTHTTDGTSVTITGYTGTGGAVVIPGTIGGLPVTQIGNEAFKEKTSITAITFPDSVLKIGDGAFYHCEYLATVTFGSGVTTIGDWAFGHCYRLKSISIPNSVTSLGNGALSDCIELESVMLGNQVPSLGRYTFTNDYKLSSITLPASIASIGEQAFSHCTKLATINFQQSVPPYMNGDAFNDIASGAMGYYPAAASGAWRSVSIFGVSLARDPATVFTPTILSSPSASSIVFGQTLALSVLSGGGASVPGTFAFSTPSNAPDAGISTQSVTFTPENVDVYNSTTTTVNVMVERATLGGASITITAPSSLVYDGNTKGYVASAAGSSEWSYQYQGRNGTEYPLFDPLAPAEVLMENRAGGSLRLSKEPDFNIWFTISSDQVALFDAVILFGESGQTTSLNIREQTLLGVESPLGGGTSSYAFKLTPETQLLGLTAAPNGTAIEIRGAYASGNGFYAHDNPGIGSTTVNPLYSDRIAAGTLDGTLYNGENYQFQLVRSPHAPEYSSVPPVNSGDYTVIATSTDPNTSGSKSENFTILKGTLSPVFIGNTLQTYDGTAKSLSAATTPAKNVVLTYNGSPTAPANVGLYTVVATVSDANYQGTASTTLRIIDPDLPVANEDAFTAKLAAGMTTKVTTASLISNDKYSGILGETRGVTFVSATGTSTGGGSIQVKGGWLIYQPIASAQNGTTDTITYTVSNGVKTATGTVTVSLVTPEYVAEVAIDRVSGDQVYFSVMPGMTFEVKGTSQLGTSPTWTTITGPNNGHWTSGADGRLIVTDPAALGAVSRFYQFRWVPGTVSLPTL